MIFLGAVATWHFAACRLPSCKVLSRIVLKQCYFVAMFSTWVHITDESSFLLYHMDVKVHVPHLVWDVMAPVHTMWWCCSGQCSAGKPIHSAIHVNLTCATNLNIVADNDIALVVASFCRVMGPAILHSSRWCFDSSLPRSQYDCLCAGTANLQNKDLRPQGTQNK